MDCSHGGCGWGWRTCFHLDKQQGPQALQAFAEQSTNLWFRLCENTKLSFISPSRLARMLISGCGCLVHSGWWPAGKVTAMWWEANMAASRTTSELGRPSSSCSSRFFVKERRNPVMATARKANASLVSLDQRKWNQGLLLRTDCSRETMWCVACVALHVPAFLLHSDMLNLTSALRNYFIGFCLEEDLKLLWAVLVRVQS